MHRNGAFVGPDTTALGRLAFALALCLSQTLGRAQTSSQRVAPTHGANTASLFLKYSGSATMRLFGVAIGPDGVMHAVGGDKAAVGRDGYVSRVTSSGNEERFVAFQSAFVGPGIDIDADQNLYLACGNKILRIAKDGKVGVLVDGFVGAFDLRIGPAGNLYVADHREGRIYRISRSLEKSVLVDYHVAPGEFVIGGLAFDKGCSHLYSYEAAKKTLWRYPMNPDGTAGAPQVVQANAPPIYSFDVDDAGNVYGADFDKGEVVKIDAQGAVTYLTEHCGLIEPIGFRLGTTGFHPGMAFVVDADGIKVVPLAGPSNSN